jgi:hypothetical protein
MLRNLLPVRIFCVSRSKPFFVVLFTYFPSGWYTITNWGNVDSLVNLRPSLGMEVIFGATVVFIVELMFLRRIWILSKQSLITVAPVLLLICVQYAFALIGASTGVTIKSFAAAVG